LGIVLLFLSDLVILALIFSAALLARELLVALLPKYANRPVYLRLYWWIFPVWIASLAYEGAYSSKLTFWDEVKLLWKSTLASLLVVLAILFIGQVGIAVSRTLIVVMFVMSLALFPPLRIGMKRILIRTGMMRSRVLIIGTGETAQRIFHALRREPNLGYDVVGFIGEGTDQRRRSLCGVKVHERLSQMERYARFADIQDIVIAVPGIERERLTHLINTLQHKVKNILYVPDVSGMAVIGMELRHFFHDQLFALEIRNNLARPANYFLKRVLDYLAGMILFVFLMIPLGIISLVIRMTSEGPAILQQERIGRKCRRFKCYKFRTMYFDADDRLHHILASDPRAKVEWETYWKLKDDPRVTPIGRFLRRTSLDELPQLFNVLKGEMSLVGPRPYLPREWDALKEHSEIIHSVQPGITGLWQVSGRNELSADQRLMMDSWYVRNWNVWLDIVILFKTVNTIFSKGGAS
jgi:undecaprenyl-phosphate galactose phosphotransferase